MAIINVLWLTSSSLFGIAKQSQVNDIFVVVKETERRGLLGLGTWVGNQSEDEDDDCESNERDHPLLCPLSKAWIRHSNFFNGVLTHCQALQVAVTLNAHVYNCLYFTLILVTDRPPNQYYN